MLLAVTACTDPTSAPTTPTESKPDPTQPGTQPSETEGHNRQSCPEQALSIGRTTIFLLICLGWTTAAAHCSFRFTTTFFISTSQDQNDIRGNCQRVGPCLMTGWSGFSRLKKMRISQAAIRLRPNLSSKPGTLQKSISHAFSLRLKNMKQPANSS